MINLHKIPNYIVEIVNKMQLAGFECFLVGGCVRDLLLDREPKDWDLTTNATPEQIQQVFTDYFYENNFGTVGIKIGVKENTTKEYYNQIISEQNVVVEITPYRIETKYSDNRHPDQVKFTKKLEDDLSRRDFTINAMALALKLNKGHSIESSQIIDLFQGQQDLTLKTVRTVANPDQRFQEDALRIMRCLRFAAELNFMIDSETMNSLIKNKDLLKNIAVERIREEFVKILMSDNPANTIALCQKIGILSYILPELEQGIGVTQNHSHIYDVWEHNLRALQYGADQKYSLEVRMGALLHDIGKVPTKREDKTNGVTFYGHEVVGAKMTQKILDRLHFSKDFIDKIVKMVRWHMFFSDVNQITLSAVRRIINSVGRENIWDLMKLRECDRIGMGRPVDNPYRLRQYRVMIEQALRDPISVKQLKINGDQIMLILAEPAGPKIGLILNALMEEVLEDSSLNNELWLTNRVVELSKMDLLSLKQIAKSGKNKVEDLENQQLQKIKQKHRVK